MGNDYIFIIHEMGEMAMMIVTDLSRLAKYGFEYCGKNRSGRETWSIQIGDPEEPDSAVNLTVNPYELKENENELVMWVDCWLGENNKRMSLEFDVYPEILLQMFADGVIKLAKEKAVA